MVSWDIYLDPMPQPRPSRADLLRLSTMTKDVNRTSINDSGICTQGVDTAIFLPHIGEGGCLGVVVRNVTVKECKAVPKFIFKFLA